MTKMKNLNQSSFRMMKIIPEHVTAAKVRISLHFGMVYPDQMRGTLADLLQSF